MNGKAEARIPSKINIYIILHKNKINNSNCFYDLVFAGVDKKYIGCVNIKNISDIDATIVMDHMILAATDVGLGTCYIGAFKKNKAHQFLNLDENEESVLFTPLGYGNAEPRDTPRKELDEFVVYID